MNKKLKHVLIALGILAAGALMVAGLRGPRPKAEDIVSQSGVHFHPEISIFIHGEEREIPANIGLLRGHSPVHTHDDDGVIHQEFGGVVTEDDLTVGGFFDTWGRTFNSECIFEFCNGEEGTVKMFVNGEESGEFENYVMKDGDRVEIRYE